MTTVRILIETPGPAGPVPATGVLRFTPTQRHTIAGNPAAVVMPASFAAALVAGAATVELEQTTALWLWMVETFVDGVSGFTRYISVPAQGPVDYANLVDVDPATLAPAAAPDPAWLAMARSTVTTGAIQGNDLILTRTDGTTVDAGNVRGPAGPANSLSIGTVTTGAAGSAATASVTGAAPSQTLSLGIPQGTPGNQGNPGDMVTVVGPASISGAVDLQITDLPSTRLRTLAGNVTLTLPTPASTLSGTITFVLTQDATGGRTIAWPAAVKWPDGIAQQPAAAAATTSVIHLLWTGAQWLGLLGGKSFA